jgi:hypothetical protein
MEAGLPPADSQVEQINSFFTTIFRSPAGRTRLAQVAAEQPQMPKNVAQFTGMVVTTIIVMGSDIDVFYALPLGIFAGALATLFVAVSDGYEKAMKA